MCHHPFLLCLAGCQTSGCSVLTLCPDDYVPRNGCVTPDQLLSNNLIESNTTFKFVRVFKMRPNQVIRFENVSNILLDTVGPDRANVTCGQGSYLIFQNVESLILQNLQFVGCGANVSATIFLENCTNSLFAEVIFTHGTSGIFASHVFATFTVNNAEFRYLQGPSLTLHNSLADLQHIDISISNSIFEHITFSDGPLFDYHQPAFAIDVRNASGNIDIANVSITNNTHADDSAGIFISSHYKITVNVNVCNYSHNGVIPSIAPTKESSEIAISSLDWVNFRDLILENNYSNFYSTVFRYLLFLSHTKTALRNVSFLRNNGYFQNAIFSDYSEFFEANNLTIANNDFRKSAVSYFRTPSTVLFSRGSSESLIADSSFISNTVTALEVIASNIYFSGRNIFASNRGYNGGGIAALGGTVVSFSGAILLFESNFAENFGGGLYASDVYDEYSLCSMTLDKISFLESKNNSAGVAGDDMYIANLHPCNQSLWSIRSNNTINVATNPSHVCDCSSCPAYFNISTVQIYPGSLFNFSLIALAHLAELPGILHVSGVPSTIHAQLLPLHPEPGSIPSQMMAQESERDCSQLQYRVISANRFEVMALTLDETHENLTMWWYNNHGVLHIPYSSGKLVPYFVEVELLSCPVGFERLNGECKCSSCLLDVVINCTLETMLLKIKPSTWISAIDMSQDNANTAIFYLQHKHCPFDFCNSRDGFEFSLEEPDARQCRHNRSGILCGECKPGQSLTLGSMECRQCTNIYLLLLIPFGLAGILLILFLSLTDMTVAAGTTNGLLFYANIVWENKATFFPPEEEGGFLSVFIAWLNLDLGISTCFFDGLDSYAYTWLQFSFPIYIWFLAFSIIIASRYVAFMNKLCGRNIIQVLGTLFLLSYTKLQRTIVTGLSFTAIDVSSGGKWYVWLQDGNVLYLQGKHIALFVVSVVFLIILFTPYTLSIMLGPWLQTKTQYRVFCWVLKLKPFFDAYFGPLKDKHRYWIGVLLLSRMILSLVTAVNALGDDSVNLLASGIISVTLMAFLCWSGGAYKSWALSLLDASLLTNLFILILATFYNRVSGGSQYASLSISTGLCFAIFNFVLLYHSFRNVSLLCGSKTN